MNFSDDEILRYGRHFNLHNVGVEGEKKLKSARILLVGLGGLGSPAALYLTAAGIGTLDIIDFDHVESHNLHRQILFSSEDVSKAV